MNVILTWMEGSKRLRHGGEIRKEGSYPIVEIGGIFYFLADYLSVVSKGYSEEAYEALVREVYRVSTSHPRHVADIRHGV